MSAGRSEDSASRRISSSQANSGCQSGLTVNRALLTVPMVLALLLTTASIASAQSFYWYGNGDSTCWQTGQLGSPSEACDSVTAGFLPTPGGHSGGLEHMFNDTVGGISKDLTLSPSGDYCSYYGEGDNLTLQISANQGGVTGYTTPEPFSSYQEGDANGTVCQANGSHWGQKIRAGVPGYSCPQGGEYPCGMHHYVSFTGQGSNNRPWSGVFGEPSLVVSDESDTTLFTHSGPYYGGWSYVCPEVEDTSSHGVIEYCLEEWRSANDESIYKGESFGECNNPFSEIRSLFYSGTQYATEMPGSANSTESAGNAHYEARITKANLINAAKLVNSHCAGWHLSEDAESYALIGVEQGLEGWDGLTELAGNTGNLQLRTEYTPLPPEATTNAASGVQQTQATLNGTVDPKGTDTHYYFQYGKTTEYGSSTSSTDAGSGTSLLLESAAVTGLQPGTTYHYRLVASSEGGAVYGSDQTFTALVGLSPMAVRNPTTGEQWVYYQGANGQLFQWIATSKWLDNELGSGEAAAPGSSPMAVRNEANGEQWVYYQGANGQIWQWVDNGSKWLNLELGNGGEAAAPGSSPMAVRNPTTGEQWVYYQGANGQIWQWVDNGSKWLNLELRQRWRGRRARVKPDGGA